MVLKLIDLPKCLILYLVLIMLPIATTIHETGHLIASEYLGIGGVIESSNINRVISLVIPVPDNAKFLFYASGGLYQFIIFFGTSLFMEKTSKTSFRMVAIQGLTEAIFEPNNYMRLSRNNFMLGVLMALLYFGYTFMKGR